MLLAQPFYALPAAESLLLSVVVGLMAPVYVLGLSILSKNKMMGLTWVKLFNLLIVLPVAAFFIPQPFSWLFGIFPTYWLFQGLYSLAEGGQFWGDLLAGLLFSGALLWLVVNRFVRQHFA